MINFPKIITQHLINENERDPWGKGDGIEFYHPSSVGYCNYQLFLSKEGLKEPNREELGLFFIGHLYHKVIQNMVINIVKLEGKILREVGTTGIILKGEYDIYDEKEGVVYDIKTVKDIRYVNQVKIEHRLQLMCYMYMLGIIKGCIIYIDKQNMVTKQYVIEYNPDIMDKIVEKLVKFHTIYTKWKKNTNEEIPFKQDICWLCKRDNNA